MRLREKEANGEKLRQTKQISRLGVRKSMKKNILGVRKDVWGTEGNVHRECVRERHRKLDRERERERAGGGQRVVLKVRGRERERDRQSRSE